MYFTTADYINIRTCVPNVYLYQSQRWCYFPRTCNQNMNYDFRHWALCVSMYFNGAQSFNFKKWLQKKGNDSIICNTKLLKITLKIWIILHC